jgi:heat shock protein HtpX
VEDLVNTVKTFLLMAGMTALLMLIGELVGGQSGMMIALVMAGVMNLGSWWFSDRIVLAMYSAKIVTEDESPELYGIVRELTQRAGMPMPRVAIIPEETPNAFATGRNPENAVVAATAGLLRILDRDELAGVMAHELAHVKNRDTLISTVAATMAGAIGMVARMGFWFGGSRDEEGGGNPVALIGALIIAPIAAMVLQMAVSRSREYGADAIGAEISGQPLALARALNKLDRIAQGHPVDVNPATSHLFIINPLGSLHGVTKLFRTHPLTEDRVARLKAIAAAM